MVSDSTTPAVFNLELTELVCGVLAQTDYPGLTAGELVAALRPANLSALDGGQNKRTRLLTTLHNAQVARGSGKTLVAFINAAMNPARYTKDPGRWDRLRGQLDAVLALYDLHISDAGKLARGGRASTLEGAARLADELLTELNRRGCHPVLLGYCSDELLSKSLFHAMGEAAKSIPDRVRRHTGLGDDGDELYNQVFGTKSSAPVIFINDYQTKSDRSEHAGFKNLLTGIHGHYRNPRAHSSRLGAKETVEDLYDSFGLFSYVHRRLDQAEVRP